MIIYKSHSYAHVYIIYYVYCLYYDIIKLFLEQYNTFFVMSIAGRVYVVRRMCAYKSSGQL